MKKRFLSLVVTLVVCISLVTVGLATPTIGAGTITGESSRTSTELTLNGQKTGVTYTNIKLPAGSRYGLNNIDVVEFKLSNKNLTVEAVNSGTYLNSQKTVKGAVTDFNSSHDGKTVLAATNADLWMTSVHSHGEVDKNGKHYNAVNTGGTFCVSRGMLIIDGEIWATPQIGNENLEAVGDEQGNSTPPKYAFGMTSDYQPLVGCPSAVISINNKTKNKTVTADGLNRLPANNSFIVYNNRVADSFAVPDAVEVEVELDSDVFKHGAVLNGTVKAVYPSGQGGAATLGKNRIILTARGTQMNKINNFSVGDQITVNCSIIADSNQALWQNCIQAVGGHMPILINGTVSTDFSRAASWPYTLIGFKNDGSVMMMVNDGRQKDYSVGLYEKDLASFCKELGYNSVFWLDGGGSSTMLTVENNGEYVLRNKPSDGSARAVINSVAVVWNDTPRGEQGSLDYIIEPYSFNPISMDFPKNMAACFNSANTAAATFEEGNVLRLTSTTDTPDAYINFSFANASPSLNASTYKYIVLRMKVPSTAMSGIFKMYLCPGTIAGATEDCTESFFPTRDGQYHTYVLDLSGKANWKGNLNAIRLDFFDGNSKGGDYVEISQFGFAKSAADADTLKVMYDQGQTHSWDNGVITVEPGYGTEGVKTYTCTHCGATKTESIPALGLKGDLNNNGVVDGADSVLLQQYIAEWDITINEAAADVNQDGTINGADVVLLLQHLAEWDIEF